MADTLVVTFVKSKGGQSSANELIFATAGRRDYSLLWQSVAEAVAANILSFSLCGIGLSSSELILLGDAFNTVD
jgi:hypothetical protein